MAVSPGQIKAQSCPRLAAMRGFSKQARQELKSCLTLLLKSFRANAYHATISGTQHALVGELADLCSAIIPIRQACKRS